MRINPLTKLAALAGFAMLGATNIASAASTPIGPLACPANTVTTNGKTVSPCITYGYFNPEDNPEVDTATKVGTLFGGTYTQFDKDDMDGETDNLFVLTGPGFAEIDYGTTTSGYFLIANSVLSSYTSFVMVLKGGNLDPEWVGFLIDVASLTAGAGNFAGYSYGTWESGRQGLSHATLYVGSRRTDVPEPGTLALLGLGLLGLGASAKRRSRAV